MKKRLMLVVVMIVAVCLAMVACVPDEVKEVDGKYHLVTLEMTEQSPDYDISTEIFDYFEMKINGGKISIEYKLDDKFFNVLTEAERLSIVKETTLEGKFTYTASDHMMTIAEGSLKGVFNYDRGVISGRINIFNLPCDITFAIYDK